MVIGNRIFFYRICGTGMGASAALLKEMGFHVEGGDLEFYPPMSTYLEKMNIPLHLLETMSDDYLKSFDLIVVGNAVSKNSVWAQKIENSGKPFTSFPQILGELVLKDRTVCGVSGTHGKTTTTYYLLQIFEKLGLDPGYFIGGGA